MQWACRQRSPGDWGKFGNWGILGGHGKKDDGAVLEIVSQFFFFFLGVDYVSCWMQGGDKGGTTRNIFEICTK